jgi:sulfatase modifying factor 1
VLGTVSLLGLALLLGSGLAPSVGVETRFVDPGPHPECPEDMRLVVGEHHDELQHLCVDPRRDVKDTHCFRYEAGITALEGATRSIRVCMDQFEAPNRRGAKPFVLRSYDSAARWCKQQGKRMCEEAEWETACEGPERLPWVYGWAVDKQACNSDKAWKPVDFGKFGRDSEAAQEESTRLWQGSPSGRYARCVSSFGVYDLMGNVEEWVTSRAGRKFPGALMGGFWAKPWTGCRGTNDAHEPTFAFYETGFRCCAEPRASGAAPSSKER